MFLDLIRTAWRQPHRSVFMEVVLPMVPLFGAAAALGYLAAAWTVGHDENLFRSVLWAVVWQTFWAVLLVGVAA